ncbi:hypothetical protein JNUCC64_17495 [Streptomyces sp. JNUCC 64]
MRFPKSSLISVGVLACLSVPLGASPAAASSMVTDSCSRTGVRGSYTGFFVSGSQIDPLRLKVDDTKADGYHPAIRLITYDSRYREVKWKWNHYTASGTTSGGYDIWDTSARWPDGITGVEIQAARFNGSTFVDSCSTFPKSNPYT